MAGHGLSARPDVPEVTAGEEVVVAVWDGSDADGVAVTPNELVEELEFESGAELGQEMSVHGLVEELFNLRSGHLPLPVSISMPP